MSMAHIWDALQLAELSTVQTIECKTKHKIEVEMFTTTQANI